ncbi:glutamate receptor 1 like protein [Danaus plexippus plexippus]|uniref:Glutamate receptor 1 like protein n=1 Tax=Danaus plexippus plexippus TaxID=278856 RepID=A0A212EMS5_DANPL|nr:glutamate receptor 1 like protein [Danaus plexippus plexippus]
MVVFWSFGFLGNLRSFGKIRLNDVLDIVSSVDLFRVDNWGSRGTDVENSLTISSVLIDLGRPEGVVFEQHSEEIQEAFKFAMVQLNTLNKTRLDFQLFVDVINTADAFKLSRLSEYNKI